MQTTLIPARQRVLPVITLLIISPIIVEYLFGSTRVSMLYLLIPQIGVYGCGALIIRTLARGLRRSWLAILIMGLAFSVAEECVILQTSFAPIFFGLYGRAFGVDWVYLLFQLGYESIWAIVIPIQLTELTFPGLRDDPWLSRRGLVITVAVFLLACAGTWYIFLRAMPIFTRGQAYHASPLAIGIALIVIVALVVVALSARLSTRVEPVARSVPNPWLIGVIGFVMALLWFVLAALAAGAAPALPAVIPLVVGLFWAIVAFFLVRYWSSSLVWRDAHRLALIFGALVAGMLVGFASGIASLPIDVIGKAVLNIITILGLSYLAWKIQRETKQVKQGLTQ